MQSIMHLRVKPTTLTNAAGQLLTFKGLFASNGTTNNAVVFHRHDVICKYEGQLISNAELDHRYTPGDAVTAPYAVTNIQTGAVTDSACRRGIGAMANHHTVRPTLNARWSTTGHGVRLTADRNITNGQEIFINYGGEYQFENAVARHVTGR